MKDLIDSKIPDTCFSMAKVIISNLSQGAFSLPMIRIAGELLLFGIPPACCPYHEADMDSSEACQVSSKRVPKHGVYERLVSAAGSAAQDFQTLADHVLDNYACFGIWASLGHYYSTMLLLNYPNLFSTTLHTSQTSRNHALHAIRKIALKAAKDEPSYKKARMATSLIHSLLQPAQPDMSPTTDDFIQLGDDAFHKGVQALLLQSCSEPFYNSTDDFYYIQGRRANKC